MLHGIPVTSKHRQASPSKLENIELPRTPSTVTYQYQHIRTEDLKHGGTKLARRKLDGMKDPLYKNTYSALCFLEPFDSKKSCN